MEDSGLRSYNKCKEKVWMDGNLFLYKAQHADKLEKKAQFDKEADTRFWIRNDGGNVFLELDMNKAWGEGTKRELVTTKKLAKTRVTRQEFDNADGSSVTIDADFFGNPRNAKNPFPGPIELSGSVEKIQIWPFRK